jgi:hypothetical protein
MTEGASTHALLSIALHCSAGAPAGQKSISRRERAIVPRCQVTDKTTFFKKQTNTIKMINVATQMHIHSDELHVDIANLAQCEQGRCLTIMAGKLIGR